MEARPAIAERRGSPTSPVLDASVAPLGPVPEAGGTAHWARREWMPVRGKRAMRTDSLLVMHYSEPIRGAVRPSRRSTRSSARWSSRRAATASPSAHRALTRSRSGPHRASSVCASAGTGVFRGEGDAVGTATQPFAGDVDLARAVALRIAGSRLRSEGAAVRAAEQVALGEDKAVKVDSFWVQGRATVSVARMRKPKRSVASPTTKSMAHPFHSALCRTEP